MQGSNRRNFGPPREFPSETIAWGCNQKNKSIVEYHQLIRNITTSVQMAADNESRASQVKIQLKSKDADLELPQETGPILVSTGKSGLVWSCQPGVS
jgi:hypothetical protein